MLTVGVDIGGSSTRASVVDEEGSVLTTLWATTPRRAGELDDIVRSLVRGLAAEYDVAAVGLAVAGFVDPARTGVSFGAHLPWRDDTLVVDRMTALLGLPVTLEHDGNAAGLAEHRVGAAAGASVAVLVALGTGIGAALLVEGKIFRGAFGVAPEIGHLVLVANGRPCPCGKCGCLERYCSGTALGAGATELLLADGASSLLRDVAEVTGRDVAEAAAAGDPLAGRVVADFARWLGQGLALVADVFDPEVVVLGGEVSSSAPLWLDDAVAHYADLVTGRGHRRLAAVRPAALGGNAAMIGAAIDARERALRARVHFSGS